MSGGETPGSDRDAVAGQESSSRLQLSPIEQELMDLKQRITVLFEEIRHSVGSVQLNYIEIVQKDLARAHEVLHALIVTECKNKVTVYKRQLSRLDKALLEVLSGMDAIEPPPIDGLVQTSPEAVFAAVFSPDDTLFATACGDGVVRISEVSTGRLIRELRGARDDLFRLVDSPDGSKLLAGGRDKIARVWDPQTGDCLATLTGHTETILGLAFLDETTVVSCSQDRTLRVWDLKTAKCKSVFQPDGSPLLCLAAYPRRNLVVVCTAEGCLLYIDIRKGTLIRSVHGHQHAIWGVNISRNGKMVCSCGEDSILRVWDAESGSFLRAFGEKCLCSNYCNFSNDSRMVAASTMENVVRIWNVENGSLVRTITGHTGWAFACTFSADDRLILTSSEDRTVRLWHVDTGEPVAPNSPKKRNPDTLLDSGDKAQEKMTHRSMEDLFNDASVNMCPEHNSALGFYCVEERKFLCEECVKNHDKEHHITDGLGMSRMAEHALQEVMLCFLQSMNGTDEMLEANMNLLMESRIAARRKVEATMSTLLDAVYARRKQLLKQVDIAFDQAMLSLRSQHQAFNKDVNERMHSFASEVTSSMLCETYLHVDTRFSQQLSPLVLQPAQICYFGNTTAQNIAAEISKMGSVAINTAPSSNFVSGAHSVSAQKSLPLAAAVAKQPPHSLASRASPAITINSSEPSSTVSLVEHISSTNAMNSQENDRDSQSPVARSSSEPLQQLSSPTHQSEKSDEAEL